MLPTPGIIDTLAGGSAKGSILSPNGVAVDRNGNIYVVSTGNNQIQKIDSNGTVTNFAGNGNFGLTGDGGRATQATLSAPQAVAVDQNGNVYIADDGNAAVRKVDSNGIINTISKGTFFLDADGVAADENGNVFVSSFDTIYKIDSGGLTTVIAGGGTDLSDGVPATTASLFDVDGVATGGGNVYILETGLGRVRKVDNNGIITTVAGGGTDANNDNIPATSAQFAFLSAVASDGTNLFIADASYGTVRKVNSRGIITTLASGLSFPAGLAVDSNNGVVIESDNGTNSIKSIDRGGSITIIASATAAKLPTIPLNSPNSVVVDTAGNVFVADTANSVIRKISPDGNTSSIFAGSVNNAGFTVDNVFSTASTLNFPNGIFLDNNSGTMYIADTLNQRIRMVSNGSISTVAGSGVAGFTGDNGPATAATLNSPSAVYFDGTNLLIADTGNNAIRKVDMNGTITTVAGTGIAGFSGDGGLATSAKLSAPRSVTVDTIGNLVISDTANNRIRAVNKGSGRINTIVGTGTGGFFGDGGPPNNARLRFPWQVTASGNAFANPTLYIADTGNAVIRFVRFGVINTIVGKGALPGFTGDGGAATSANLNKPTSFATDGTTNTFYIADSGNDRVRRIYGVYFTVNVVAASVGSPGSVAIQVFDARTNTIAKNYTGTVQVTSSDALALLPPNYTFTSTDAGMRNLPIVFGTSGLQTVTATDTVQSSLTATGSAIIITANASPIGFVPPPPPPNPAKIVSSLSVSAQAGVGFSYTLTAVGDAPLTLSIDNTTVPAGLTAANGVITGTPTATGTFSVKLTASNPAGTDSKVLSLTINPPPPPPPAPAVSGLTASPNPAKSNDVITFSVVAVDPNNRSLTISWDFGDQTTLSGNPVTHSYVVTADTTFTVKVSVTNGGPPVTLSVQETVFAPNSGAAGVPNIDTNKPEVINPLDNIGITVADSSGAVIVLIIDPEAVLRASYDVSTDFGDLPGRGTTGVAGTRPIHKYTKSGVFAATSSVTNKSTGVFKGKARKTLPISKRETGEPTKATKPPSDSNFNVTKSKGTFTFTRGALTSRAVKTDNVTLTGTVTLAPGLDLSETQELWVSFGNIAEMAQITSKGTPTAATKKGANGLFKSVKVKYPKKAKGNTITVEGDTATVTATISAANMISNGFDTEGIASDRDGSALSIQAAMALGGETYESQIPVTLKVSKNKQTATIFSRGQ